MTENMRQEKIAGKMLKDLSLRMSPAFPNFEAVFDKSGHRTDNRFRAVILVFGIAAGIVVGFGLGRSAENYGFIAGREPLIDSWYQDTAYYQESSSPQDIALYIQDLWAYPSI